MSNANSEQFFCPPIKKLKRPLKTFTQRRNEKQCMLNKRLPAHVIFIILILYNGMSRFTALGHLGRNLKSFS